MAQTTHDAVWVPEAAQAARETRVAEYFEIYYFCMLGMGPSVEVERVVGMLLYNLLMFGTNIAIAG